MDEEEIERKYQAFKQEKLQPCRNHKHDWLRHNAMVPKGFLRFHVLNALNEKSMSGSELMDEIQKHTGGNWKPSPGSIYPLLAWLQDNAYITELPTENGLKRYELTQTGKGLLQEQIKIRENFSKDGGFFAIPFFDRLLSNVPKEKTEQIHASIKRLFVSSMKLAKSFKENYSEKDLDEALKVLNEASIKIEEINSKIKGESKNE